jgi:hypothetical protein
MQKRIRISVLHGYDFVYQNPNRPGHLTPEPGPEVIGIGHIFTRSYIIFRFLFHRTPKSSLLKIDFVKIPRSLETSIFLLLSSGGSEKGFQPFAIGFDLFV